MTPDQMPPAQPEQGGEMPPEMAMQVLQKFGITPQDLPEIAQAVQAMIASGAMDQEPTAPEHPDAKLNSTIDAAMAQHGAPPA
jgi:hypothetical protein